jgi:hypothetical protein
LKAAVKKYTYIGFFLSVVSGGHSQAMLRVPKEYKSKFWLNFSQSRFGYSSKVSSNPIREIASVVHLKNMYNNLNNDKKHLSLIHGMALTQSSALRRLFSLCEIMTEKDNTLQLMRELFHMQGSQLLVTQNKTNPGYSLNAELAARIIHHMQEKTYTETAMKEELIGLWQQEHKRVCGERLTRARVEKILTCIQSAAEEASRHFYLPNTVESLLLAFLYNKASDKSYLLKYMCELKALGCYIASNATESLDEIYTLPELNQLRAAIGKTHKEKGETLFNENYERSLCALATADSLPLPSQVFQSSYGFKGSISRPNCFEAAFHDFLNLLFYNPESRTFDLNLLPASVTPRQCLRQFYEDQHYEQHNVNSSLVGQAFMNMVSGLNFIEYFQQKNYEVYPTVDNFIRLANNLLGIEAKNLDQLAKALSDDFSKVTIDCTSESFGTLLTISITHTKVNKDYTILFKLNPGSNHAELVRQGDTKEGILCDASFVLTLWDRVIKNDYDAASLALFLPCSEDIRYPLTRGQLVHMCLACDWENPNAVLRAIDFISQYLHLYTDLKDLMRALLKRLPANDEYFASNGYLKVARILSKKLKQYPHLDEMLLFLLQDVPQSFIYNTAQTLALMQAPAFSSRIEHYCRQHLQNMDVIPTIDQSLHRISIYLHNSHTGGTPRLYTFDDILYLMDLGAKPYVETYPMWTLFTHLARPSSILKWNEKEYQECINRILTFGININMPIYHKFTPLHYLASTGNVAALKAFMTHKANPNCTNSDGETPLHRACANGLSVTFIKMLVDYGANINSKDDLGKTPLDKACGNPEIENYLRSCGALKANELKPA